MFVPLDLNTPAVLVDTQSGTVLAASPVRAVPLDVWEENQMDMRLDQGMSDSEIASFGERYGVPLFVRVS